MARVTSQRLAVLLGSWAGPGPAYSELAERIRLLTLDGRLPDGTRLPAERDLAVGLGLSRTTIAAAYARLRELGCLESVRGSGSYVVIPGPPAVPAPDAGGVLDLTKAAMPAASIVAECAVRAVEALGPELARSGYELVGLPVLRVAVAEHFARRGLPTDPDQIMITNGVQHAIALLARALLSPGDRAAVEQPTYPHAMDTLLAARARLVPLPVDPSGWDLDALSAALGAASPALAYVMPDFQNPTGASLSVPEREALARSAAMSGTLLIADETTALLDISRGPLPPLAAFAPSAVTLGGLSKLAWGGLRVGWIRAPRALVARLAQARTGLDLGTPVLEQLVASELLGREDALVAERSARLREGLGALTTALADHLPEWRVPPADGGMALWADCSPLSSSRLVLAVRRHGVALTAGPRFGVNGAFEHRLRLPFTASPEALRAAVTALRDAAGEAPAGSAEPPLVAV
ncbi:GntR family transcriptional regulator [Sinomonas cellulolyticus]|uniref:PLP-dependent aminotransferase family protein n=1 Tax=Sinomonas cellulolyticus TaxID=2801916 RepID=A0ABS1K4Q7_9MICC|nr:MULTISPECIES: PLP-dependent aminotransferase family protein [Sinomonas]MBL0705266.1 PLP-dependent aminotransferase family protein [Sinomonas cellulolyticus]GHG40222.1 GntR family transcriptional regulator [Sinomonas sp. KCTC 49339]